MSCNDEWLVTWQSFQNNQHLTAASQQFCIITNRMCVWYITALLLVTVLCVHLWSTDMIVMLLLTRCQGFPLSIRRQEGNTFMMFMTVGIIKPSCSPSVFSMLQINSVFLQLWPMTISTKFSKCAFPSFQITFFSLFICQLEIYLWIISLFHTSLT